MEALEKDPLLADLNPRQVEAVTHDEGPLLVLAGAGSGKTRVLTHRIAWLVERAGVDPREILALTFTNKAAKEMGERVQKLLGPRAALVWLGTFHAIALRILRRHGDLISVGPGFAVYDTDDQRRLGRAIVAEMRLDPKKFSVNALISTVGREKDEGRGPEESLPGAYDRWSETFREFYRRYTKKLLDARAMDFGDLLVGVLKLFTAHPEVADNYARRFKHILIDEYQDTNRLQYLIARRIADAWGNISAVGDDDQSIYGWRGADITNILSFADRFAGAKVVKLEQNYRSTSLILDAAGSVISRNIGRMGKTLWTSREGGEKVRIHAAATEEEEGAWIVARIRELVSLGETPSSMAVLYRAHALSRPIEEALLNAGVPYVVYGGLRFYERREIKDVLSYLRLTVNPSDTVSLFRVINSPPRGIGDRTLEKMAEEAAQRDLPLWEATIAALGEGVFGSRAGRALAGFVGMVEGWRSEVSSSAVAAMIERIMEESGYRAALEFEKDGRATERLENLQELLSAAKAFDEAERGEIAGFLDRAALVSDQDRGAGGYEAVTLMTIHSAKGLEYPTVFIAGMEEGLFPHALSSGSEAELEEERRLCYVAMTRARERLILTRSRVRTVYGSFGEARAPSRFLQELPEELRPREFFRPQPMRQAEFSAQARKAEREPLPLKDSGQGERYILPEPGEAAYRAGMRVRHGRYGPGRIEEVSGSGALARLTVAFVDGSRRKFVAGPAALEILLDA